jgi:hypothetical protein
VFIFIPLHKNIILFNKRITRRMEIELGSWASHESANHRCQDSLKNRCTSMNKKCHFWGSPCWWWWWWWALIAEKEEKLHWKAHSSRQKKSYLSQVNSQSHIHIYLSWI